jgi:DNA polymerase-3 subunit gamma/tau
VIDATTVEAAFGVTGRRFARALVDAILGTDAAAALRVVDQASDAGADMLGLIRGAIAEYRNLLVARIDTELLARDLSSADVEAVVALAASTAQPRIVRGLRLLADALAAGRSSGNPRLELETAVLRLIVQAEDPSLEALATRVALLEQGAPQAAPPARTPAVVSRVEPARALSAPSRRGELPAELPLESSPPSSEPRAAAEPAPQARAEPPTETPAEQARETPAEPTLQQVRSLWDQIRLRAEEKWKPLRGFLSRATVDAVEGRTLVVGLVDNTQEGILRGRVELVEQAVDDVLRVPLRVVFKTHSGAESGRARATSAHRAAPDQAANAPGASASEPGGEVDLLAYARKKLGGTETA